MKTRILAFANQKGGVGKTTTAVNLATGLADRHQKTLLIDLDPQANATSALGHEKDPGASVYQPLLGEAALRDKIIASGIKNLDLVPSEMDLAGAEVEIARSESYLHRLQEALRNVVAEESYRYIFIDCPPSLGILTCNALTAAQSIVIPVQCEYLALEGLSMISRLIQQLRDSGANPELEIEGIVMTMFDGRTNLATQVAGEVRRHFGANVYETLIPRNIRISEAPSFGKPVSIYDPRSPGAKAYRKLALEFMRRRKLATEQPEQVVEQPKQDIEQPEQTPETLPAEPSPQHAPEPTVVANQNKNGSAQLRPPVG